MQAVEDEVEGGSVVDLIDDHDYTGDRFEFRDLEESLVDATAGEVQIIRPTLQHMYAIVRAPV